ncbi:MAG: hypothetical protein JRE70_16075 [Deltaproteobacteria bacterium]|nr:hypothetical protein [Deltaproteobacteria bacterium]
MGGDRLWSGSARLRCALLVVLAWLSIAGAARAQVLDPGDAISRISARDITESLVSLNNFTASPGIEGSNLSTDLGDGQPNLEYGRFSIQIPISIQTRLSWLNVYTEIGYGSLFVDDKFFARTLAGETLAIFSERQVDSGRLGLGVEWRPTTGWQIAPYLAASVSGLSSKTRFAGGNFDPGSISPVEQVLLSDWSAAAWSLGGVLDVKYLRWFGVERNRLDLQARYAISWTETFNESLRILDTSDLRNTLVFEALWRSITDVRVFKKRLSWNVFANSTSFPGQDKDDLGFTYYFGLGAGVDLYIPERLWGKIGRNFIGIRGSAIVGDDVRGWSIVLSLRN